MKKRIQHLLLAIVLASSVFPFVASPTDAGNLTAISDTMSRLKLSEDSNHTIAFTQAGTTQFVATETIALTFAAGFDLTDLANSDPLDYDIRVASTDESIVANGGCAANDAIEITSISGQVITFTACGSYTSEIAGSAITVKIGTHTSVPSAGDNYIANPGSSGSKTISIGGNFGDTGSLAVAIMTEDQVTVSATVDPSITSLLSASTCALGALNNSSVQTCQYTNTVNTNAGSGYAATILDDGSLRNLTNDINDAAGDNDVDQGSEEYGVGTSDDSQTIIENDDCDDPGDNPEPASAITTSAQQYASAGGPVTNEATTLCHAASVAGATPAGSYQHIVTHITTGTF